MSALTRFLYPVPARRSVGSIIRWWEGRRLAYNVVVGATGIATLMVVTALELLPPGSHGLLAPLGAVLIYAAVANVCYTAGWVLEALAHTIFGDELLPFGPALFRQGLLFSVGLTLLPIVVSTIDWGFRFLRWIS
jgi:hypothetical protein